MKTYEDIINEIAENSSNGYETAVIGYNGKAVKYGSLIGDKCEMPDKAKNCTLQIWNNENINDFLKDYTII